MKDLSENKGLTKAGIQTGQKDFPKEMGRSVLEINSYNIWPFKHNSLPEDSNF